ncbi:peptide/nickel transport system permease protein [Lachnotalea glycerini]|uniref:Peptide/nickel transport system permease protein n=1 Tax=Lachnotalea glycerini TaxID=1763509 RepID=A0A318EQC5_9FIRM|nr:ABC transporter permease [Lachnotalea glycerini]OYO42997.1 GNAT family acetyltransferase [Lachnotalea glycerini]PXV91794.1 peptide/nickel transport system permease protein [Lachnotalea glycerini]
MKKKQMIPGILGVILLFVIIVCSIFAPILAPSNPYAVDMTQTLMPPSRQHLMGTDILGRDMLSRILYGGRSSMLIALAATAASMLIGMMIGTLSAYYGGLVDEVLMVILNIFQGLPGTSLMIAIAGIMGSSMKSLMIALVITSWTGFARIVRTEVLKLKTENFIEGLKCLGASNGTIIRKHVIPNMKGNTIVLFATRMGRCILSIAALSFLGLGVQPPTPDWSVMISDARMNFRSSPHLIIIPGLCMFLLLLSINLIGDMLRDIFDKKTGEAGGYQ